MSNGNSTEARRARFTPERKAALIEAKKASRKPLAERYWAKVDTSGGPDACWPWLGSKNPDGYGKIFPGPDRLPPNYPKGSTVMAHHIACEFAGIEVPPGMVRDHICKRRDCQNPRHIRIVTQAENCGPLANPTPFEYFRNRTACEQGHEFTPENTHWQYNSTKRRHRVCLTCFRARYPGTKKQPNTRETAYMQPHMKAVLAAPCKGCNAAPCHCDPRDPLAAARRGGYEEA